MIVLGIETTCDETACALVENGEKIHIDVIASQYETHREYRGVYPEMASRCHSDRLIPVIDEAIKKSGISHGEIDLIAVANRPGLMGSLLMGLSCAKALSYAWNVPFLGINHVEAHLYAAMMGAEKLFPALGIVISGGHTFLTKINNIGSYELIGTTVDDAIGEAFDKVAVMLGYPYPGGPQIELIAKKGNPHAYPFKGGTVKGKPYHFSFSGLKTNVLYQVKGQNLSGKEKLSKQETWDIAASFQRAALESIKQKALKAAETFDCRAIYIGGGVSNNLYLRNLFQEVSYPVFWPKKGLSLDNASMIAGLAYHLYSKGDPLDLEAIPRIL